VIPDGIHVGLAELIALRPRALGLAASRPRASRESLVGSRQSPFRGRGMEFAESRPYAAGDDVRHIDWRVTARSGKVHSKLFQPERERVTAIVADTSATMAFGTRSCFKSVQAARLGALLAWLALADGDRLCAASFGSHQRLLPATGGRRGALRVLELLVEGYALPLPEAASGQVATSLAATLERLSRLLRPGSHILLLLDPRSVDEAARIALARLRAHHDVVAALLIDPLELAAPARAAWNAHFQQQLDTALDRLRRSGVRAHSVSTAQDPLAALRDLLHGRAPRRDAA
jgi:uncharacterized protein (DUF58 family)